MDSVGEGGAGLDSKVRRGGCIAVLSNTWREGSFDMECGGKREQGRDAALDQRDLRHLGISKQPCEIQSGVAASLCHRTP